MTMIFTDSEVETLNRQTANLWGEVNELRATLAERDMEQCEMEGVIEFLIDRDRTHQYVLGATIAAVFGRDHWLHHHLYSDPVGQFKNMQGRHIVWNRPRRRWAQFGSKARLVAMAEIVGLGTKRQTREYLIRDLWALRALPGSVAYPFRPTLNVEVEVTS